MTTQAVWRELRMRLMSDVIVIDDCTRRLIDGVSSLTPGTPSLDYVEKQLQFMAERVRRAQDLVADVKRDGPESLLAVVKGGGT